LTKLDSLEMLTDLTLDVLRERRIELRATTANGRGDSALINIGAMAGRAPNS
jgi:hypothetical protein